MLRVCFCAGFAAVLSFHSAAGAEITEEGARALRGVLQVYLGQPAAGEPETVVVVPDGQAYRVSIDLQRLAAPLAQWDVTVGPATIAFHAAPQDDGTWRIADLALPSSLAIRAGPSSVAYTFAGYQFAGTFDPKIASFVQATTSLAKLGAEWLTPSAHASVSYADSSAEQRGSAAGPDAANLEIHQTMGTFVEKIEPLEKGGQQEGQSSPANLAFTMKTASAGIDIGMTALRAPAALDLWAFLVAHHSFGVGGGDTSGLKQRLSALLPMFAEFSEAATANDLGIETALGVFSLKQTDIKLEGTGAMPSGRFGFRWRGNGLRLPENLLPAWQKPLVPTAFDIGASVSGIDLDAAAREAIADLDLAGKEPFSPQARAAIGAALTRNGPIKLSIPSTRFVSPSLEVEASGDVTLTQPRPAVHVEVRAKGLNEALAGLLVAAGTDKAAAEALALLAAAKGMGKTGADGRTVWVIELGADGKPTVNGAPLGK